MVTVSNAGRIVFPAAGKTKGDVVAYYERIAPRALAHVRDRPLSIRRYPKGLADKGFFQKNVPAHYPESMARFAVPRSRDATKKHPGAAHDLTVYPVLTRSEELAYLANQGAIELHVPATRVNDQGRPDRMIFDLDPPAGALDAVRRAARVVRDALEEYGLASLPVATGSKGYHVVAPITPELDAAALALTAQKLATLLAARHPDLLTTVYRIAQRKGRVFVDWLRNNPNATVVAPYSLRATDRATVAAPIAWEELEEVAPDTFTIDAAELLLSRADPLAQATGRSARPLCARVDEEFDRSGLELEVFDRFRS